MCALDFAAARYPLRGWLQALFGNLGEHKLGPAVEARAEVLSAEAGDDSSKQVRSTPLRSFEALKPGRP